jgi:acetolactate synthase I/II/III large subunit
MRAAELIVQSLKAHGIGRVYCVPGESYLALLDALFESGIQVIVCRHEGGAGFMACAEAKLTGKPAVFMVSRGPGATNASIAIHMAEQDALPVMLLIGQVSREERTRGVFQEMDYGQFFGGMAKGIHEVTDGEKLRELLPRYLRLAQEGVAGPVVIALPEDVLNDDVRDRPALEPYPLPLPAPSASQLQELQQLIDHSERPLLIVGSQFRGEQQSTKLARFAQAQRIPVATTWKNQDVFDNASELYAGHIGTGVPQAYRALLQESDLIIAAGTRLGDFASLGYTLPAAPTPQQHFVHIYSDGRPIGKVTRPDLAMIADPAATLAELATSARVVPSGRENWNKRIKLQVKEMQAFTDSNPDDGIDFGRVVVALEQFAPRNCIITTDAGNMSTWVHRHWKMTPQNTLIGGIVGAMGLGVPAAVAASINQPHRMAICIVGDGGVLMTGQELATAMAYGVAPKIVISDNGIYGTIRTHQEREYPGRVSGTLLTNPDFAAWATSFGAAAFALEMGADVDAVVKQFLAAPGAAVLHVKSSRKALSAFGRLPNGSA